MAPEMLKNEEYTNTVDIWAFGMVLYEMMTLNEPFHDTISHFDISDKVLNGKLPRISNIHKTYYKNINTIRNECIELDPKKRLTCYELLNAFTLLLAGKKI